MIMVSVAIWKLFSVCCDGEEFFSVFFSFLNTSKKNQTFFLNKKRRSTFFIFLTLCFFSRLTMSIKPLAAFGRRSKGKQAESTGLFRQEPPWQQTKKKSQTIEQRVTWLLTNRPISELGTLPSSRAKKAIGHSGTLMPTHNATNSAVKSSARPESTTWNMFLFDCDFFL